MQLGDMRRRIAAFHDVAAAAAVHVQVDEARKQLRCGRFARRRGANGRALDAGDAPGVVELDRAVDEALRREHQARKGLHPSRLISATKS